jgi:hypothetical protein
MEEEKVDVWRCTNADPLSSDQPIVLLFPPAIILLKF